ncbi:MAG: membrane protein insertase YidC [Chitinophagales bacterium]|nr:membrane protein insertase YidC [Chitinophagales bacterium]MDW8428281.1 membrane protein insertase YidC [Chitinophagales bacterium]
MDRNTVIGFLLITLLIIAYTLYNIPSAEELERQQRIADSIAAVRAQEQKKLEQVEMPQPIVEKPTPVASALFRGDTTTEPKFFTLENDLLRVSFSTVGAYPASVEIKHYKTYDQKPLVLFSPQNSKLNYIFFAQNQEVQTADVVYAVETGPAIAKEGDSAWIRFHAYGPYGSHLEHYYALAPNSAAISYRFSLYGIDSLISTPSPYMQLNWMVRFNHTEKDLATERNNSTIYLRTREGDVDGISERSTGEKHLPGNIQWVSAKTHFFNITLISKELFDEGRISSAFAENDTFVKDLRAELILPLEPAPQVQYHFSLYAGPNNYQALKRTGLGLEQIIPLGAGLFGAMSLPLNKYFIIPLFNWLDNYHLHYGVIILIMTVILRIILFPLTYRSFVSAAKMKVLKPEIDELREKYKDDPTRFGQEQMNLFRRAGVNPFGGCIPLLLQLPILAAMYTFFPLSVELRQQKLWWADDLSTYDSILELGFTIPFYGSHVSLFTIIMTATSVAFAVYNNQLAGVQGPMKWMAYLMPIMLLGFFNSLPAALTYYYSLSNVFAFIQQFAIKKWFIDEEAIHRKIQENKKRPLKKSRWQERLEQLQKQQQQRLRERQKQRSHR